MLILLVLGNIEAFDLLGTNQGHTHLPILFILVGILLLHLSDLGMLTPLDFSLVHHLVVVFLLLVILVLSTLFAALSSFVLLTTTIAVVLVLTITNLAFLLLLILALLMLLVIILILVVASFFTDLHDCYLFIVIVGVSSGCRCKRSL